MPRLKRIWNVVYNVLMMPDHVMGRHHPVDAGATTVPVKPGFGRTTEPPRARLEPGDPGRR